MKISPGIVYQDGNVTVKAFLVNHGEVPQAFGYRFETPDRTIVISGDTSPSQSVIDNCDGWISWSTKSCRRRGTSLGGASMAGLFTEVPHLNSAAGRACDESSTEVAHPVPPHICGISRVPSDARRLQRPVRVRPRFGYLLTLRRDRSQQASLRWPGNGRIADRLKLMGLAGSAR